MINQNGAVENHQSDIQFAFGKAIKELQICKLLKTSNICKNKGESAFDIFQFLLILVFQNCNLYHFLSSKKQDIAFSKNTYYRFLNSPKYNWKKFILLLAVKVTTYFASLTRPGRVNCLVIDDSVVPHQRSKKVELLSKVFNHVIGKTVRGKRVHCDSLIRCCS